MRVSTSLWVVLREASRLQCSVASIWARSARCASVNRAASSPSGGSGASASAVIPEFCTRSPEPPRGAANAFGPRMS